MNNDTFGRPNWDTYYLTIAHVVASRSIDPSTKHGCVLVSKDNRILSTGYNGPLKDVNDNKVPLTRPKKYMHLLHAEENALLAYGGSNSDIQGGTCYVTGPCCHKCLRMLIQKGITRIVRGTIQSAMLDTEELEASNLMIELSGIEIKTIDTLDILGEMGNISKRIKDKIAQN